MHQFLFLACSLFLFACNNSTSVSKEVLAEFDSVNKALEQSNNAVSGSGDDIKKKLQHLADTDPAVWKKIVDVDEAASSFTAYSDSISRAFATFCGTDESGGLAPASEGNISLSTTYFIEQGNGPHYFHRLATFSARARAAALTDSTKSFAEELISVPSTITQASLPPSPERFSKAYFKQVPPVAALTIIAKFRNDAKLLRAIIFDEYHKLVSSQP